MSLTEHVIYGGLASAAVYPKFGAVNAGLFFAGSLLIDLDHYPDFVYFSRFRDWNPIRAHKFHRITSKLKETRPMLGLEAFHTGEYLIGVLAAGICFRSVGVLSCLAGMIFHLGLDLWRLSRTGHTFVRALSFIEYWIRRRTWLKRGENPESLFFDAYALLPKA